MQYLYKSPNSERWLPIETDSLNSEVSRGRLKWGWQIKRADGTHQMTVGEMIQGKAPTSSEESLPFSTAPDASTLTIAALRRYRDGYSVARVIDGFGGLIKGVGIALGILIAFSGLLIGAQTNFVVGACFVLSGLITAIPLYVLGILVSAQAQIIKAAFDGAVHTSPFLDDTEKAKAMSLS